MGVEPRHRLVQPVAGEQRAAALGAAGGVGAAGGPAAPRHALHLAPDGHERVEARHRLGHEGHAGPPQGRQGRAVLGLAVVPDAAAHEGVGLEQAQHRVGQQGLARPRRAHHGHDLALVDGDGQVVDDLHVALGRAEERGRLVVVHPEGHREPLHLQQVMAVAVARAGGVGVVVMHRRGAVVEGLVGRLRGGGAGRGRRLHDLRGRCQAARRLLRDRGARGAPQLLLHSPHLPTPGRHGDPPAFSTSFPPGRTASRRPRAPGPGTPRATTCPPRGSPWPRRG